jgi:hypothetical protein
MIVLPSSPGSNTASSRGWPPMARCMVRMMSPRSPRARKVFSASAWVVQVPGCASSARPRRCKHCKRPISSRRWRCSFGSLKRLTCTRPSSPASRCSVWKSTTIEVFIRAVHEYILWYNEKRIKISLGSLSPIEYRESLGLIN